MNTLQNLTIDTPEQTTLELPLAGIGSRLLAFIYDSLLQGLLFFVLLLVFAFAGAALPTRWFAWIPEWILPVLLLLFWFCMYWGYFALFEIFWKGQTPGKRQAGIRVIKDSGRPMNAFEAIARNLLRAVDALPGMYGVALISMIISPQNKRLGDYVAGTVVIHDNKAAPVHADWISDSPSHDPVQVPAQATLTDNELLLIETFIERRSELADDVRQLNALQIATQLAQRHQITIPPGTSPEQFIENLARAARDNARFKE